jgi:hypothetical protein
MGIVGDFDSTISGSLDASRQGREYATHASQEKEEL